ncbi:hypothetical protein LG52_2982 [Geobacillus kaustophilus]|jgi:hypothetical protein|uniref:Uncharacterized protein n=1 Tax=Geobacillus kaustophilus TaxID=1462 RepID=A0A0D8BYU0_GEOKU|nr:hypothetical protein LG52_2982 [Geobacillus kaustophilus]
MKNKKARYNNQPRKMVHTNWLGVKIPEKRKGEGKVAKFRRVF